MQCDFCESTLPDGEPVNLALLTHVETNESCREQLGFHLDNLNASWTPSMSGG